MTCNTIYAQQRFFMSAIDVDPNDVIVDSRFYRDNPNLPSINTVISYDAKMIKEVQKCSKDIIHFALNYYTIVNLDRGKEKIPLYAIQKKILKLLVKEQRVCLVSSRQMGKTTLISIFALWFTTFNSDKTVLIVANKEKTAKEVLSRIRMAYEMVPAWLKAPVTEWQKESIEFSNGSKIIISSTSSTAARGTSINCLIVDECAHIDDFKQEEFFASVLPVISSSTKTKIFLTSTPNGTGNYFYKTYTKADQGTTDWKAFAVHWKDIPGRDENWRKRALDDLNGDKMMFAQEYENCFLNTGETAIDVELIKEFRSSARMPLILNTSDYKVWARPIPKSIYTIGVDVADGVGGCASCIQVVDITDLTDIKQVACYNSRYVDTTNFSRELFNIAQQWGKPYLAIERNAMGGEVVVNLRRPPYNYERIISYNCDKRVNATKDGIESSTNVKYHGISNMRYWMNVLRSVHLPDLATIQELETFVKSPNGTWKKQNTSNTYDDRVMALVWALFVLHLPIAETIFEIVQHDEQGKPLKIKKMYDDEDDLHLNFDTFQKIDDYDEMPVYMGNRTTQKDGYEDLMQAGWRPATMGR